MGDRGIKITRDSGANLKILRSLEKKGLIEIHDVLLENRTGRVSQKILPVAVWGQTKYGECVWASDDCKYDRIREIIGKNNIGDAIKLEAHIRNRFKYFITEDNDFLNRRSTLYREFKVNILTPVELSEILNSDNCFQSRIGFNDNIVPVLEIVCFDYNFGQYENHQVVPVGYEDFNVIVTTEKGKYFLKFFATFRDDSECQKYVDLMLKVIEVGVRHPKLYKSSQWYLYQKTFGSAKVRLCAMEFIDGQSLYDTNAKVSQDEARFLVHQAALINQLQIAPRKIYDSWAIVNFLKEYQEKKQFLDPADDQLIAPLTKQFEKLELAKLPHCLVHGDIIKTNVMKNRAGELYIIDFSVSNFYPRIQELAVLFCNILFDEDQPQDFPAFYTSALQEYQRSIKLTDAELKALPLFVHVAHAMHALCATYEKKAKGNTSPENEYWIKMGQRGLHGLKDWQP